MRSKRVTGRRLQRRRAAVFRERPLCVLCLARNPPLHVAAVELDHVHPLHLGGSDDEANLQPLCRECHDAKTARERGARRRPKRGRAAWEKRIGELTGDKPQ